MTKKVQTKFGEMDEDKLRKKEGMLDNDNEKTTTVEYCLADCDGPAHTTGVPDSPHCFCSKHVHRSVDVTLKPKAGAVAKSDVGRFA